MYGRERSSQHNLCTLSTACWKCKLERPMSRSSQWPSLEQGLGAYQPLLPHGLVFSRRKTGQEQLQGIHLFRAIHWSHQTNLVEHICPEMCLKPWNALFSLISFYFSYLLSSWFPLVLGCLKTSDPLKIVCLPDEVAVCPGPQDTYHPACRAAAPLEISDKNQLSLILAGRSRKTGTYGSPVCGEWLFLCFTCISEDFFFP